MGVYGFDAIEPLILAALVSEDPVLLIGKAGTGKTFLLNNLAAAMGLCHRHYNASFVSFDDLIGFPYPEAETRQITFLQTPATIWAAQSVLIDELSRCKPEIQNKFFSIIQEKKVQGMPLDCLRYRWAAMNPLAAEEQNDGELYEGSLALDHALADRFGFIIRVPDWQDLSVEDQELIIRSRQTGEYTDTALAFSAMIDRLREHFLALDGQPDDEVVRYARISASLLTEAGLRISPRRAKILARNITALLVVTRELYARDGEAARPEDFRLALNWSLPHRAFRATLPQSTIDAVHAEAVRAVFEKRREERWLNEFMIGKSLPARIRMLVEDEAPADLKSIAVLQFLGSATPPEAACFALACQPYFLERNMLNEEAMNELTLLAGKLFSVRGTLEWREGFNERNTKHPAWSECVVYLNSIPGGSNRRKDRARQLFLYLLCNNHPVYMPDMLEAQLEECFRTVQEYVKKDRANGTPELAGR